MTAEANKRGFILCPKCGRRTKTMVYQETEMISFPLWCTWCKKETIIDFRQSLEPEQPEK